MTFRLIPLTRLACAVAVLGLPWPRSAQYWHASCAYDSPSPLATGGFYDGGSDAVSGCIRSISEGRAAVLLPSALLPIKRVPANASLRGHAWGFLDDRAASRSSRSSTRSAISITGWPPCSGKASGAISTPAAAAIAPRFDEVSDFVEAGLAIVTLTAGARSSTARASRPATRWIWPRRARRKAMRCS